MEPSGSSSRRALWPSAPTPQAWRCVPPKEQLDNGTSFNPVHIYLLARQGVHILEYHNQEGLQKIKVYKFAYILGVNKIKGTVAGTVLRPIGIV